MTELNVWQTKCHICPVKDWELFVAATVMQAAVLPRGGERDRWLAWQLRDLWLHATHSSISNSLMRDLKKCKDAAWNTLIFTGTRHSLMLFFSFIHWHYLQAGNVNHFVQCQSYKYFYKYLLIKGVNDIYTLQNLGWMRLRSIISCALVISSFTVQATWNIFNRFNIDIDMKAKIWDIFKI